MICLLMSYSFICCTSNDADNSPKPIDPDSVPKDNTKPEDNPKPVVEIKFQILKDSIILKSGGTDTLDFTINLPKEEISFDKDNGNYKLELKFAQNDLQPKAYAVTAVEQIKDKIETSFRLYIEDLYIKNNYDDSIQIKITKKEDNAIYLSPKLRVRLTCDNTIKKYLDTNLPLVKIETVNKEEPKCDYVSPPKNYWGAGIKNATKVPGSLCILKNDDILYNSGNYEKDSCGITIKIRGNTSAYSDKKPYKIKLQKKADLLKRNDDKKFKDKDWVLLKYNGLKTLVGFKVNELLGMQWTPSFQFVNLMINGDYRGLYMLCESVKRDKNCRLNVDETGYIIEYDAYWWNEDVYFVSDFTNQMNYTFKYPDEKDITSEKIDYIKQYVKALETAIITGGAYENYMDVNSWANWLLVQDILGNGDSGGANMFITKFDNTDSSKLMMGNLWDFDSSYIMDTSWSVQHTADVLYFPKLLANKNKIFKDTYKSNWSKVSPYLLEEMNTFLNEFGHSETAKGLDASIVLDNKRWGSTDNTISKEISISKSWFTVRMFFLDQFIPNL